ncbi:MAG: proline dehydrogenase [Propionibacteriaceae bacterium]|jgi:proline dehydrogenase|nr:Proline dehydrogenase [Propionibacteriaceae bacterium]MDX6322545.1 proline dehydrogenase [Propionibacteriaceae bacterium]
MLRRTLLAVSRSQRIKDLVTRTPVSSDLVSRFVPGESVDDAVSASRRLIGSGLSVTVDHLGEDTRDSRQADAVTSAYVELLARLRDAGLTGAAEVSVKLSALGLLLPQDGARIALGNARIICRAAGDAGTTVTLDMEDHTTTDVTLDTLSELRKDFPATGAVLQAYLRRTEADCEDLATAGSRVRLCKGAYDEPGTVAFIDRAEVDLSYVRCLKILMAGDGYPMLATHDPRLIEIGQSLARSNDRAQGTYEFQMLYGIRPAEQQRLANLGHTVRIYLPYGADWYRYLVRRLAERPANLAFFARSLLTKS